MSKYNLNPFLTATVVLFALLTANVTSGQILPWLQTANVPIPSIRSDGSYYGITVPCPHYPVDRDPWNDVYTTNKNPDTKEKARLENVVTNHLNFPVGGISAEDVDRFFDTSYEGAGYTRDKRDSGSGASLAMNCHGFSTGKGVWLQEFSTIQRQVDYTEQSQAKFLVDVEDLKTGQARRADNIVIAASTGGHSVRVAAVGRKLISGEVEYQVVETLEKFLVSGRYKKEITPQIYAGTDDIKIPITTSVKYNQPVKTDTVTSFYKAK